MRVLSSVASFRISYKLGTMLNKSLHNVKVCVNIFQLEGEVMKVDHAVKHFGSQVKLARALDISESAVSRWKSRNGIVPIKVALEIKDLTDGEVDLILSDY